MFIFTLVLRALVQLSHQHNPCWCFFCFLFVFVAGVCFWSKVSCKPGWLQTHYGAVGDLQFLTLSPQTPECWVSRYVPGYLTIPFHSLMEWLSPLCLWWVWLADVAHLDGYFPALTIHRPILDTGPHRKRPWDASGLSKLFTHTIRAFVRAPSGWQPWKKSTRQAHTVGLTRAPNKDSRHWDVLRSAVCPGSTCWGGSSTPCESVYLIALQLWPLTFVTVTFPATTQSINIRLFTVSPAKFYIRMIPAQLSIVPNGWNNLGLWGGPLYYQCLMHGRSRFYCGTHLQSRLLPSQGLLQASIWRCLFPAPQISTLSFFFFANTAGKSRKAFLKLRHLWLLQMLDFFLVSLLGLMYLFMPPDNFS